MKEKNTKHAKALSMIVASVASLMMIVGCVQPAKSNSSNSTQNTTQPSPLEFHFTYSEKAKSFKPKPLNTGSQAIKYLDTSSQSSSVSSESASTLKNTDMDILTFNIPNTEIEDLSNSVKGDYGALITGKKPGDATLLDITATTETGAQLSITKAAFLNEESLPYSGSNSDSTYQTSTQSSSVVTVAGQSSVYVTYKDIASYKTKSDRFNTLMARASGASQIDYSKTENTTYSENLIVLSCDTDSKVTNVAPCNIIINIVDSSAPIQTESLILDYSGSDKLAKPKHYISYTDKLLSKTRQFDVLKEDIRSKFKDNDSSEMKLTFFDSNGKEFVDQTADSVITYLQNESKSTGKYVLSGNTIQFQISDQTGNKTDILSAKITLKDDIEPYITKDAETNTIKTGTIISGLTAETAPYPTSEFKSILLDSIDKKQYKIYDEIAYPDGEDFKTSKHINIDEDSNGQISISITDESGNATGVTTEPNQHVKVSDNGISSENLINDVSSPDATKYYFINNSSCDVAAVKCNPIGNIVELQKPISVTRSGTTFPCDITQYGLGSDTTSYYADSNDQKNIKFDLGSGSKNITIATDAIRLSGASNQTISIYNSKDSKTIILKKRAFYLDCINSTKVYTINIDLHNLEFSCDQGAFEFASNLGITENVTFNFYSVSSDDHTKLTVAEQTKIASITDIVTQRNSNVTKTYSTAGLVI